jgi:putative transposase
MIAATVEELTPLIGTRPACRALGASPATIYRHRGPTEPRPSRPRPAPARALSEPERERVLEVLHSERFVDVSPEETWATLLDEGRYLCSPRTMYRILAAHHGGVRERRNQLTHPPYAKPELLAKRPNELWSWDVSKLKGPAQWTYYYLYVMLDVFSRYIVGWTVQYRENGQLAKALIEQATEQQKITPGLLTLHADRGGPQRAKPVAFLLADLGIIKTHSRPYTSTDNPYSESNFKTLKYRPEFPARFDSLEHAREHCRAFVDWYNHAHRHSGIGLMTPAAFHHGQAQQLHAARARVLQAAFAAHPERFVRKPPAPPELPTAAWINKPNAKEVAHSYGGTVVKRDRRRLTVGWLALSGRCRGGTSGRSSLSTAGSDSYTRAGTSRPGIRRGSPSKSGRGRPQGSVAHSELASLRATSVGLPGCSCSPRQRPGRGR